MWDPWLGSTLNHCGQAQGDLPDRLVPASLYGLKMVRPGYLSAYDGPATLAQAIGRPSRPVTVVKGIWITSVIMMWTKMHAWWGALDSSHQVRALFICPQPECSVAGGHGFLFTTLEQWVAHWNTCHVAVTPLFHCIWCCNYSRASLQRGRWEPYMVDRVI